MQKQVCDECGADMPHSAFQRCERDNGGFEVYYQTLYIQGKESVLTVTSNKSVDICGHCVLDLLAFSLGPREVKR